MLDTFTMAKQLSGEYRETFEAADVYSTTVHLTGAELDEKMMELYDLLLTAQTDGKPAEEIVGQDLELFCQNFFEKEHEVFSVKELLKTLNFIMIIELISALLDLLVWKEESDLSPIIIGFLGGMLINLFVKHWLQPVVLKKKIKPYIYYIISVVSFLFIIGLISVLTSKYSFMVTSWPIAVVSGVYVLIYNAVIVLRKLQKGEKLWGTKREDKELIKEFNHDMLQTQRTVTTIDGLVKRYKVMQKRNARKDKEYTFEEFAQLIRKDADGVVKVKWITGIIFAAVVIGSAVTGVEGDFLFDGLLFMVFMGIVEYFIWKWINKTNIELMQLQVQIIEECEAKGMDIFEYVEDIYQSEE